MHYAASRPELKLVRLDSIDPLLVSLLSICTPHKHEHHIVKIIKEHIKGKHVIEEIEGNILIKVLNKDNSNSTSMFSCHMDMIGTIAKHNEEKGTVDSIMLLEPTNSKLSGMLYAAKNIINTETKVHIKYDPCTLGADDKVGVFILLKMIDKSIPGLYVFHIGEECGGIGSVYLSKNHVDRFKDIKRAIAFDRANYSDIIEFQRGGRCCSNVFGKALAAELNIEMPPKEKFKDGITGTFTDTANYRDIIPECTNISVGYFNQHGSNENLDYIWLKHILLPAILKVNYESLPTERDPKAVNTTTYRNNTTYTNNWPRKSWKEANKDTKSYDLPHWEPKLGYIDAKDDVLLRSIEAFVQGTYTTAARAELAEYLHDTLMMNHMLTLEYNDMKLTIAKLINKGKHGSVESIEIAKKKKLLTSLIELAKVDTINTKLKIYWSEAEKFLDVNRAKVIEEDYNSKELKKFNRFIIMLSYYISITLDLSQEQEKLMDEVYDYIAAHVNEEGFTIENQQLPRLTKDITPTIINTSIINDKPSDNPILH